MLPRALLKSLPLEGKVPPQGADEVEKVQP